MKKVEIRLAYAWDCDECGRENFDRGVVPCMSDDERMEAIEALGFDPGDQGVLITTPDVVTCRECGATFETVDFRENE